MDKGFFQELGNAARAAIHSQNNRRPSNKSTAEHFDPVTDADKAAERAMRFLIEARFPEHGILGEEYGWTREGAASHWSLDPIDGTRAFVCGLPSWAVLVGYLENGRHVAGMIDLPALGERLVATGGTTMRLLGDDEEKVSVSRCEKLADARISTTDPGLFSDTQRAGFGRLVTAAPITRYGLDAMAYARIATGDIDLVAETGLKPHDYDALVTVVEGAGGVIGNWSGESDLLAGDVVAAASEALYSEAVSLLSDR